MSGAAIFPFLFRHKDGKKYTIKLSEDMKEQKGCRKETFEESFFFIAPRPKSFYDQRQLTDFSQLKEKRCILEKNIF